MNTPSAGYIYWLHLIILPLFVYIGVKKSTTPTFVFNIVLGIAIVGILYHIFKLTALYRQENPQRKSN